MSERFTDLAAPVPGDGAGGALSLGTAATLLGEYRWIEAALHRVVGGWVRTMPLASVQVHLDGQSMRHAWHAELWADRLPVLTGLDADRLTQPQAAAAACFAVLEGPMADGSEPPDDGGDGAPAGPGALPLVAGLYRVVLPRLVTSYRRHLDLTTPVADAPVARALRLVLHDEVEDWLAGERLVQGLLTRPHDVAAVASFQERLESAVVGAGTHPGLAALPGAPRPA